MFPPSVPLTLGSVVVRRLIDSCTGHIPSTAIHTGGYTGAVASSMVVFSGLLCWLYRHLKNGTLVRIGIGHKGSAYTPTPSRSGIHRRTRNDSWFLRNARACRSRCTDAVFRLAKNSYDSLHKIQHGTGGILKNKLRVPYFSNESRYKSTYSGNNCNNNNVPLKRNVDDTGDTNAPAAAKCRLLYNNEDFDRCSSSQDVTQPTVHKDEKIRSHNNIEPYRVPITRRGGVTRSSADRRRGSERIKKKSNSQKITRKTRSGRVYAYRL